MSNVEGLTCQTRFLGMLLDNHSVLTMQQVQELVVFNPNVKIIMGKLKVWLCNNCLQEAPTDFFGEIKPKRVSSNACFAKPNDQRDSIIF